MTSKVRPSDLPARLADDGSPVWDYFDENGDGHNYEPGQKHRNSDAYATTELRSITSFEQAKALATEKFGSLQNASEEMGTGFTVLNGADKQRLVGVPFVILSIDRNDGDQGPFVSFLCVTKDGVRYVVNDGGTGIFSQLDEWLGRGGNAGGILVEGGLRKSEYEHPIHGHAVTFYLNV